LLLTKEVEITLNNRNIKYFENMGYQLPKRKDSVGRWTVPRGSKITVKVEHLNEGSNAIVEVKCDYCSKVFKISYKTYRLRKEQSAVKKDACQKCKGKKIKESNLINYGVEHVMQIKEINEKVMNQIRVPIHTVRSLFIEKGYVPLFKDEDYLNNRSKLQYKCLKHPDYIQEIDYHSLRRGHGCWYCGYENSAEKLRLDQETVFQELRKEGLFPVPGEIYRGIHYPIRYICKKHYQVIQTIRYSNFRNGDRCRFCGIEAKSGSNHYNWKGGITPIQLYLRGKITPWREDSIKKWNNICVITGKPADDVHHLYSFHLIVEETFQELKMEIKPRVEDYTQEELKRLSEKCLEIHYRYPLGVCLTNEIHNLFHSIYGYGDNTPEQFEEFKTRYYSNEFAKSG